jgi:hypothetical protein
LINLGIRYQVATKARVGFGIGWWPLGRGILRWENLQALNADNHHFGGSPEYQGLRPFYVRAGLNFVFDSNEVYFLTPYLKTGMIIGKGETGAISFDLGGGYNLVNKNSGMVPFILLSGINFNLRL